MTSDQSIRAHIERVLQWGDAHADFDATIGGLSADLRGVAPAGLPYSPWQLLEHMRRSQADILEFCQGPPYTEKTWPADYWPADPAPPTAQAWDDSIAAFRRDRAAMQVMAMDPACDLVAKVPAGTGQTFLREFLLNADHNAYHLGQILVLRRLLGAWDAS